MTLVHSSTGRELTRDAKWIKRFVISSQEQLVLWRQRISRAFCTWQIFYIYIYKLIYLNILISLSVWWRWYWAYHTAIKASSVFIYTHYMCIWTHMYVSICVHICLQCPLPPTQQWGTTGLSVCLLKEGRFPGTSLSDFSFFLGPHLVLLRGYSWLCSETLLVWFRGPFIESEIELRLATCKTSDLPTILSFHPTKWVVVSEKGEM